MSLQLAEQFEANEQYKEDYNEYKKEFGQYEYDELKNFKYLIGDKFDEGKNNVFVNKYQLGQDKIDINNIMKPEEIQTL